MRNFIRAAVAAGALGAASLAMVQPAEARYHDGGAAVAAGIIGLGVGAAIASADRPHYYRSGYAPYYEAPVYYAPAYGYGYYGGGYDRGYYRGYDHRGWDHRDYGRDHGGWRR